MENQPRRQLKPALVRPDIADVAAPDLVLLLDVKLPLQQVGGHGIPVPAVSLNIFLQRARKALACISFLTLPCPPGSSAPQVPTRCGAKRPAAFALTQVWTF